MNAVPYKPHHVPQLTPCLTVEAPEKAINFYELAFGFEKIGEPIIRNGLAVFAEMYCLEARIMLQRQGSFSSPSQTPNTSDIQQGIGLYVYVPNIETHFTRANSCGATILSEVLDTFWGDRIYTAKDLDGYIWTFAQHVSEPQITEEEISNSGLILEEDELENLEE